MAIKMAISILILVIFVIFSMIPIINYIKIKKKK